MNYIWLNIGSLVFVLIAWILPFINFAQKNKRKDANTGIFYIASISCCSISLCMQIFYINHLVSINDWTAMMDTLGAVSFASAVMVIVTVVLNLSTYILYKEK